ncbi:uncharacterized protein LOC144749721 [Ciona intestinalis]
MNKASKSSSDSILDEIHEDFVRAVKAEILQTIISTSICSDVLAKCEQVLDDKRVKLKKGRSVWKSLMIRMKSGPSTVGDGAKVGTIVGRGSFLAKKSIGSYGSVNISELSSIKLLRCLKL